MMTLESRSIPILFEAAITPRKYKRVSAVIVDGKVMRRAHWRNYGREVPGGVSGVDRLAMNVSANNAMYARLIAGRVSGG